MKVEGAIEFSIVEQTADRVVAEMPIRAGIKNPYGVVHAGAMLWFADVSATLLVMGPNRAAERMSGFPLAINLSASLLGNQSDGTFTAVASFVKRGRTVSVVRTMVYGAEQTPIADITTTHVLSK